MSGNIILFLIVAGGTLAAAVMVVTTRNMVHAALWLVGALFGAAVLFVFLNAAFLAVVQVVVYIGAIAVLMIFAVMLTGQIGEADMPRAHKGWPAAALLSLVLFGGLTFLYLDLDEVAITPPALDPGYSMVEELGQQLVSPQAYVLPFELASVLLLAALIGSIVIAWRE